MDTLLILTIIFIVFLIIAFFVWFFIHRTKERERLLLLEKGTDPSKLPYRSTFSFPWLKIGCVVTSSVIGLIIGLRLENFQEGAAVIGIVLFGGIGLIIAHFVDQSDDKS